jgi:hypothetical protein
MQNSDIDAEITKPEWEKLELALKVLRSGTDYADFLQWWLLDVGARVVSPNPPAALLEPRPPESSQDEELIIFGQSPLFIQ